MKIILNKDVYNLGEEGDVCEVARGYARNYLFPKELALAYTRENIAKIENRRSAIEKRKEEKRNSALSLKERLDGKEITLKMNAGQGGKLFGSVTNAMIADELQKEGIEIERRKIEVASNQIKMIGTYPVRVKLYENNDAQLKIKVVNQSGSDEIEKQPEEKTAKEKKSKKVKEAETPAAEAVEAAPTEEAADTAAEADSAEAPAQESVEEAAETAAETDSAEVPEEEAAEDQEISPEAAAAEETLKKEEE